eukprot:GHRR01019151.1.p2 GENE.GHRR01019151.1~~GHRR01019151.1.p2  ORF type:complete len:121 (-),score=46.75 GHRR01019151.1:681-1043(-)
MHQAASKQLPVTSNAPALRCVTAVLAEHPAAASARETPVAFNSWQHRPGIQGQLPACLDMHDTCSCSTDPATDQSSIASSHRQESAGTHDLLIAIIYKAAVIGAQAAIMDAADTTLLLRC